MMKKKYFLPLSLILVLAFLLFFLNYEEARAACSGTADYETPGTDVCSSEYSSTYACAKASDGDTTNFWLSAPNNIPGWVYGDLGEKKCISGIRVFLHTACVSQTMNILVSDDASSWTTVVSNWTVDTGDTWVEKTFTETSGQYVKLEITSATCSFSVVREYEVKTRTYTTDGTPTDGTPTDEEDYAGPPELPLTLGGVIDMIETAAVWVFNITIALGVVMTLISAFLFLTAGGDPTKVNKAKNFLMWGIVGLGVAFFARGFISLLKSFIGAV